MKPITFVQYYVGDLRRLILYFKDRRIEFVGGELQCKLQLDNCFLRPDFVAYDWASLPRNF